MVCKSLSLLTIYFLVVTRYPEDKPLFFKPLPKDKEFKSLSTTKGEWDEVVDGLEVSKKTLFILKNTLFDGINKYKDLADAKIAAGKKNCDALEVKYTILDTKKDAVKATCEIACIVIPLPFSSMTSPACVPCLGIYNIAAAAVGIAQGAWLACDNVVLGFLEVFVTTWTLSLWGFHYAIKVA